MGKDRSQGGSSLNIDSGNNPTIGKRVLFFTEREDGAGVDANPAKILANFGSLKRAPNDPGAPPVNPFCKSAPAGQVVYLLKVETAGSDYRVEAYADSGRSAGTFDEYKDGDLRV